MGSVYRLFISHILFQLLIVWSDSFSEINIIQPDKEASVHGAQILFAVLTRVLN